MAVLDFPSNPSSGDSYTSPVGVKYRYNGYAWDLDTEPVVGPEGPAGQDGEFIILDVPPENPDVGTTWFDSTNGRSFIWYLNEDGNGQWVEHAQPIGPEGPPAPGGTPIGTIAIWSGAIDSIPLGWMPCDGVDGRPDLRDKFIVGAGSAYSSGDTGGSADAIVVAHSHTVYAGSGTGDQSIPPADGDGNTGEYAQTTSTAGEDGVGKNLPPYFALFYIIKVTGDLTDGPQGPVGPAGPQGEVGPVGPQGIQGEIGPQGIGLRYVGRVDNYDALTAITTPTHGDVYIANDTREGWVWNSTTSVWDNAGVLVGAQGPQGETGPAGPQGEAGPVGPTGPAAPGVKAWGYVVNGVLERGFNVSSVSGGNPTTVYFSTPMETTVYAVTISSNTPADQYSRPWHVQSRATDSVAFFIGQDPSAGFSFVVYE